MAGVVLLDVVRSVLKLEISMEADLQESLTGLTVRHLKDLFNEFQVKTSGTKAILIGELVPIGSVKTLVKAPLDLRYCSYQPWTSRL